MRQKKHDKGNNNFFPKHVISFLAFKAADSVVSLNVIFRKINSKYENPFSFRAKLVFTIMV